LERLQKEGEAGRRKINEYTRLATVVICLGQSWFWLQALKGGFGTGPGLILPGFDSGFRGFYFMVGGTITMTAGTIFLMCVGEQIDAYGIGNGISLLIMAGILARMPQAAMDMLSPAFTQGVKLGSDTGIERFLLLGALFIFVVVWVIAITKGERRIPIQSAKHVRGRRVMGGQRQHLPLRVNQAGVMPIIFASIMFIVPTVLYTLFGTTFFQRTFGWGGFWYILFYSALVFLFSFFWTSLMFQPKEIADNLKEYGGFVPGLRPGARTAEFLESVMFKVTLAGATFLVIIAVLPQLISSNVPNMPAGLAMFLGGTSILIVVGVILDLIDKVNSMLVMRRYEGLGESGAGWARRGGGRGAA
jgi:preprotein translocase subunit SecY